jgi:hypothetical protein
MGVTGTDHVIKMLDLWTIRNGKAAELPQQSGGRPHSSVSLDAIFGILA